MRLTIKSKNDIVRAETDKFDYNGQFMAIPSVVTSISSPTPIPFDIGDYIVFREDIFRLSYTPAALKQARTGTDGEAFVYENMKFTSIADDLTAIDFLDVVLYDNNIHFSSLPAFEFYAASVQDLADRLQANLNRVFVGAEKWTVRVHPEAVSRSRNIKINNIKCWQALGLAHSEFGLNFIIRGRTITIGTEGIAVGKVFGYGKGKGLYDIRQTTNEDALIITRLRAFGSTRNLPYRYYNNIKDEQGNPLISESVNIPNLMLPSFPREIQDPQGVFIDSPNIAKYGIREGNVYFDGSGDNDEIYPSIENMTAEQLAAVGINVSLPSGDNGKLNEVLGAENPTDDGILIEGVELPAYFKVYLKDLGFDLTDKEIRVADFQISMKSGMNESRTFDVVDVKKDTSLGYTRFVLECKRFTDSTTNMVYPNKNWSIKAGDQFVLLGISMPEVYIKAASQRLLEAAKPYLAANDESKNTYTPSVDSKFMAENPTIGATIREGDIFLFEDTDLDIYGGVIIQTLRISFGDSSIPTYEISLGNEKIASTLEKIQDALSGLASGGGIQYNIDQIKSILETVGDSLFLSKLYDDVAKGNISFEKSVKSKTFFDGVEGQGWLINPQGHGVFDSLFARKNIRVGKSIGSPEFTSGFPNGVGWDISSYIKTNAGGIDETKYRLEIDDAIIRGRLRVFEFIISQLRGEDDNVMFSGGMKVDHYDHETGRIYLQTDEGILYNPFRAGDALLVQRFGGLPSAGNNFNIIKQYELQVKEASVGDLTAGEKRLDWITFTNFVGDLNDVTDGDILNRADSYTDSTRKGIVKITTIDEIGAPHIDVVYGMKTDPLHSTKARLGNLSGIRTRNGADLTGLWGLYAEGAVLENSTVYLGDGQTVEQRFVVMEGRLESEISSIRDDMSKDSNNILRNSSFTNNTHYWKSLDDISIINVGGSFLWFNANFYSDKRAVADIFRDGNRNVLRVLKTKITQYEQYYQFPEQGIEVLPVEAETFSYTLFYKVVRPGVLKIGIPNTALYEELPLNDVSDSYTRHTKVAEWDRKGNFEISFTGEILVYGVSLFEDAIAGTLAKMWTQIEQNEAQIALRATKQYVDTETGAIRQQFSSELSVMAEEIALRATKIYVDTETTRITNQWQSELSIKAGQIEASVKSWTNNQLTNYSTLTQTSNQISGVVSDMNIMYNSLGGRITTLESAGFITKASGNTLWAKKEMENGETIISTINQTPEAVKIRAKNISLEGTVTANNYFKINTDGSMETIAGKIGGFTISGSYLGSGQGVAGFGVFDEFIKFRDNNRVAFFGSQIEPIPGSAYMGCMSIQNTQSESPYGNRGMRINVANGYEYLGTPPNIAIEVQSGLTILRESSICGYSSFQPTSTNNTMNFRDGTQIFIHSTTLSDVYFPKRDKLLQSLNLSTTSARYMIINVTIAVSRWGVGDYRISMPSGHVMLNRGGGNVSYISIPKGGACMFTLVLTDEYYCVAHT